MSSHPSTTEEIKTVGDLPVEKIDKTDYRIYAAISYFVILIVIGLPLWWKTTEVYRVPLPYTRIAALNESDFVLVTNVTIASLDIDRGKQLASDLDNFFKTSKLFKVHFVVTQVQKQILASAQSIQALELSSVSRRQAGDILLLEVPGLPRFTPSQVLVGRRRIVYFATDTSSVKLTEVLQQWLFQEETLQRMISSMVSPTKSELDLAGRRRMPTASAYDVMVTIVNPDPEKVQLNWDLQEAIENFLSPFLRNLAPLADYNVKSQWLYFVPLQVQPKLVPEQPGIRKHFALSEELLPHIITPLEKKLASHVSQNPCLNFVVYVPPCSESPLYIYRQEGVILRGGVNAFLSPRWGGIIIHNPPQDICDNTTVVEPKPVEADWSKIMGTFLAQLRLLVGVPELDDIPRVSMLPLAASGMRQWELDSLYRVRIMEQLTSAMLTLQSLSQLLGEISNIVIDDEVGDSIQEAVSAVERGIELLHQGNLLAAFEASKQAFLSAEAAFTDPSLLALLYFPDDQKYAVYIPLFLPVMIPVLMSLKNIYLWAASKVRHKGKEKVD
ncbi:hypothetical protein R5R35_004719 [Gryllus longicercus]|uniref:GPI transamidase component PIG-S n=1 Tax=Gryllus longicercus TaxID=2509291 RepID=A0AAN9Z1F9_9ORTH